MSINTEQKTGAAGERVGELRLPGLVKRLRQYGEPVDFADLKELLWRLDIREEDIQPYLQFDASTYQRNEVVKTDHFEMLFLCFEAGQRTPIHDHAGSACAVKVVRGTGTETLFETSIEGGWLFASDSRELPAGGVVGSFDMDTHQLSNLQSSGKQLVTLHIYSPPLTQVGNYSMIDNSVKQVTPAVNKPDDV